MLEATDVDNLLEKFEDASQDYSVAEEESGKKTKDTSVAQHSGPLTFSRNNQDPHKTSQIIAAVQSHFEISSPSDINGSCANSSVIGRRPPRIGNFY